jgi:hypothetical protein
MKALIVGCGNIAADYGTRVRLTVNFYVKGYTTGYNHVLLTLL